MLKAPGWITCPLAWREQAVISSHPSNPPNPTPHSESSRAGSREAPMSRISTLARVVTGVSLYNGLVDGSIPVDNAIAELMNAGSISFQELENFKKDKVDDFAKKATEIGGNLKPKTETFEKALRDLAKIKEMWTFGDEMSKLPDANKFAELKSMETIDLKAIEEFDLDDVNRKLSANPASDIPSIQTKLTNIADASKKAQALMKDKNILTTLNEMAPFHKFAQILTFLEASVYHKVTDESNSHATEIQSNFQSLEGLTTGDGSSLFSAMKSIASSQSSKTSINRQYTSGLVNGYLDLERLPNDAEDSWLLNQYGWLKLKDGLTILSNLKEKTKELNKKWSLLDKDNLHRAIQEAEYIESSAKGIKDRAGSLNSVITEINAINLPSSVSGFTAGMTARSQQLSELHRKSESVSEIADVCEKFSDSINSLDSANSDSIQNALKLLDSLKPHVTGLKIGGKVNTIAKEIVTNSQKFTQINQDATVISYTTYFNNLKNMKQDLSGAASVAELATRLRDLKSPDFSKDVTDASTTVVSSVDSIKALRTEMESIKSSPSDKTNMLTQLKDLQKFSKPLGDSATVIAKVQKTLELKSELLNFIQKGHVVDKAGTITDSAATLKTIRENWLHFNDVSVKINKILNAAQNWKDNLVKPDDDKFESYGPILEKLVGLEDVDLDVKSRIFAVQTLIGKATDPAFKDAKTQLDSLQTSLVALAPLDLTFAQYSVAGMTDVLTGISKAFGGTAPTSTMRPVTKPVSTGDNNITDLAMDMETTPKPGFTWPVWGTYLVVGVVIVAALCAAIYGAVYVYRRLRPKTVKIDDDSGSNSGEEKDADSKNKKEKQPNKNSKGNKQGGKNSKSNSKSNATSKSSDSTAASISKVETPATPATGTKLSTASTSNASQNPAENKQSEISKESKNSKDSKDSKNSKDSKDSKDSKESKKPDQTKGSKETKQKKKKDQGKGKAESKAEPKNVDESQLRDNVPYSEGYAVSERAPGSSIASARGASTESVPKNTAKEENNGEGTFDGTEDIIKKT
ncbi:hypothetical protein CAEBREN_11331 [Caenorhabditis brenneri]|uniref:Domain of unknown function WSN domain-containing protein n=1 Tax=Caenorhabditis brenneri TaxID=135651 RepID=G0NSH8_CAEBE|nr:hypothetical protein CAEBREN_11331 [Caenorhabditis brenneri]